MDSARWMNIALVLSGIVAGCVASEAHEMVAAPPISTAQAQSPTAMPTVRSWGRPVSPLGTATGSAVAYSRPAPLPKYPTARKAKRWQLHCVNPPFHEELTLQRYGAAGWELVGTGQYRTGFCFKRPAP